MEPLARSPSGLAPGLLQRKIQRRALQREAGSETGEEQLPGGAGEEKIGRDTTAGQEAPRVSSGDAYAPPGPLPPRPAELNALEHEHPTAVRSPRDTASDPAKEPSPVKDHEKGGGDMTGIGATVALGRFVAAAKDVQKGWDKLKPDERANKLGNAANDELKRVGVIEATPNLEDLGTFAGEFHFSTWILGLGKRAFSAAGVTDADASDIAATVYHESRHAEQWHRMARLLAGQGKKADAIVMEMSVPAKVAADAEKKPLKDATTGEGKEADDWYQSVYGSKASERSKLFREIRPKLRQALDEAQVEYDKVVADKSAGKDKKDAACANWKKAYDTYNREYYQKYRSLPEEKDAWAAEDKAKAAYGAKK